MAVWRQAPAVDPAGVGMDVAVLDQMADRFAEAADRGDLFSGAQMAVYRHGRLVLDVGGGVARGRINAPVEPDTMFVIFSSTKGLAACLTIDLWAYEWHPGIGVKWGQWPDLYWKGCDLAPYRETFAKAAAAGDAAPYPRFFGTGPGVTVTGDMLAASAGAFTPSTAAEARAAARTLKAAGADAIKVMRDDFGWASTRRLGVMGADVLAALVDEAHREGLAVFAHAPMLEHAKAVLRAGADGLLHGIIDRPVDREFLDLLARNRAVYVPTLSLYEDVADVASWGRRQSAHHEGGPLTPIADSFAAPAFVAQFQAIFDNTAATRRQLQTQRENVKRVFDAGGTVVMGTDAGFFGVLMGVSSQMELGLMVEAGLSPEAALRAATINAARMMKREKDFGSVEEGKAADLLILDADPRQDVRNVRRIHRVLKGGVVYDPQQLLGGITVTAPRGAGGRPGGPVKN